MEGMKLKLLIVCIVVGGLVGLIASPAAAVTIISQSANTDITLGLPFSDVEFENPLAGTEMVKEYAVIEWRDADFAWGPPRWYDDWSVSDPCNIDGNINEIWMRRLGHTIWTTTTVASNTVSIHLIGDNNDGLAEVLVDGVQVAKLDMYTSPSSQTALIIVKNLAKTPHAIAVKDLGLNPGGPAGADDVATLGAAALEKRIKWSQPPEPAQPGNVFYGWNEISDFNGKQIVADDWVCNTDDPVTDIHWWGSYQGWKFGDDPSVTPSSFHITIWTDVAASGTTDFSHPGKVVWETDCTNFSSTFVGWDYDPRTESYEACFKFDQILEESEYFFQKLNEPGTNPNIYWISIAAKYPATADVNHRWGWKTRPRDSTSPAPDDAVRIFDPVMPHMNDQYISGEPIEYPAGRSWDMAFELTARPIVPYAKWSQKPKFPPQGGPCYWGWDERSQFGPMMPPYRPQIVADDWACDTKDPVKDIHWWGSYIGWTDDIPPQHELPDAFHIGVWTDVQPSPPIDNFSHPGMMIWEWRVDRSELFEIYDGCDEHPEIPGGRETCFYYEYKIPEGQWFYQEPDAAGNSTIYWLSISAMYINVPDPIFPWGWKTREHDPDSLAPDDAVRIFDPTAPDLVNNQYRDGEPIEWQDTSWDTAFELTSTRYGPEYVKWSQPPVLYTPPDAINGWDEHSVYGNHRIVADDWFCDSNDPVADIHWWGSFIDWSEKELPPEMIPEAFHIAIWTDVPAVIGIPDSYSHPGTVLWETVCREFTVEFAGWDFDPRIPDGAIGTLPPDACFKFEQDIPDGQWFRQGPGAHIYWISIAAMYPTGTTPQHPWGWKMRPQNPDSRAPDDAVRVFDPCAPVLGAPYVDGMPIYWPSPQESWDACFVLTTKPVPPKPPVDHLKWSQPPIEIRPGSRVPIYCGWDEMSYNKDFQNQNGPWKIVADDFRCLGRMPVSSVHWWGSYTRWVGFDPPPVLPTAWHIGFWSNVPKPDGEWDPGDPYKMHYPQLPDPNGWDLDITYMNMNVSADDWRCTKNGPVTDIHFWYSWLKDQVGIIDSIRVVIYDNVPADPGIPGSYSHPGNQQWERDFPAGQFSTRYWGEGDQGYMMPRGSMIQPNDHKRIYQCNIVNIPQPFYQVKDEIYWLAISISLSDTVDTKIGWKTSGSKQFEDDAVYRSPTGGWAPWKDPFTEDSLDLAFVITDDVPYSHPEKLLHQIRIPADRVETEWVGEDKFPLRLPESCFQYYVDLKPREYFRQKKYLDQTQDNIFWMSIVAVYDPDFTYIPYPWGWKTRPWSWMDDAVTFNRPVSPDPTIGPIDPHTITPIEDAQVCDFPQSYDVAFELDTEPDYIKWEQPFTGIRNWPHYEAMWSTSTEWIDGTLLYFTLVADDWLCERKTPVTAAVWWGSYINYGLPYRGYGYEACQCPTEPRPAPPDYFLLTIWDNIPADADPLVPFSHPNEIIWRYRADDYDEVLFGYDKHPIGEPNVAVFRYSVRLPEDDWFQQEDVNDIYWFSVMAVYKGPLPERIWGWTNHEHVFEDNAVLGDVLPPSPVPDFVWWELYDQTGKSEDMSFMLLSDCAACSYDLNGDGYLGPEDLTAYMVMLNNYAAQFYYVYPTDPDFDPCLDANGDGYLGPEDLTRLMVLLNAYAADWYYVLCDGAPLP